MVYRASYASMDGRVLSVPATVKRVHMRTMNHHGTVTRVTPAKSCGTHHPKVADALQTSTVWTTMKMAHSKYRVAHTAAMRVHVKTRMPEDVYTTPMAGTCQQNATMALQLAPLPVAPEAPVHVTDTATNILLSVPFAQMQVVTKESMQENFLKRSRNLFQAILKHTFLSLPLLVHYDRLPAKLLYSFMSFV